MLITFYFLNAACFEYSWDQSIKLPYSLLFLKGKAGEIITFIDFFIAL